MSEQFDLEAVYDEKISPLMEQVIAICKEHRMPMLATFLYRVAGDGDDPEQMFCTTVINEARGQRHSVEINRALDIIRNGLPENRAMAFTVTTRSPR